MPVKWNMLSIEKATRALKALAKNTESAIFLQRETGKGELFSMKLKGIIFLVVGCISLGLGCIGIILPILPTVPFFGNRILFCKQLTKIT
ncbi:MAG: hypothetical protein ACLTE2_01965 [Eubacteriales bacterium]